VSFNVALGVSGWSLLKHIAVHLNRERIPNSLLDEEYVT